MPLIMYGLDDAEYRLRIFCKRFFLILIIN